MLRGWSILRNLETQREKVAASITEQGAMTDEIAAALEAAATLAEVEDIYRPYKPKKKTRASVAREKGLMPLAEKIFAQKIGYPGLSELAKTILTPLRALKTKKVHFRAQAILLQK